MNPSATRFDTFAAYLQALDEVLALGERELLVFDPDLKATELESPPRVERLAGLLGKRRDNRVRIALHDPVHVERHCPRLTRIAARYAHNLEFRQTPEDLRHLRESFIVADNAHAVVRFHSDYARGKLLVDHANEAGDYVRRFEELWSLSMPVLAPTRLGL